MVKIDLNRVFSIVSELQATNSRKDKMAILKANKDDEDLRYWLDVVYNPYRIYGIQQKKLSKLFKIANNKLTSQKDSFKDVVEYLSQHNTGRDTDVLRVVQYLQTIADGDLKQFAANSITKSVKIGATAKTINSVFGKGFIPEFSVQLAKKYVEEQSTIPENEVLYVTTKLDGSRCICFNRPEGVSFFTRQGQPILGLSDIAKEVRCFPKRIVLDGELLLDNPDNLDSATLYRETMKEVRKDGIKHNVIFNVFDLVGLNEWDQNDFRGGYEARRIDLDRLFNTYKTKWVKPVDLLYKGTNRKYIDELLDKVVAEGKEGLMINRDLPYTKKRTSNLLKMKKFLTADVKIVDLIEGQGKYKGMLGAAVANFPCSDGTLNKFEIGSGWSDKLRKEVWNNQEKYIGSIIEIGYFEISKNSKTGKESLRFPTMRRLRPDKTEESWY